MLPIEARWGKLTGSIFPETFYLFVKKAETYNCF